MHPDIHWDITSEPSNRYAKEDYRNALNLIENQVYRSGITSLSALDQNYKTFHMGVLFDKWSPYFETFNDVKIWFESNGIMEKWRRDTKLVSKKQDELGPQILTMDHLKIGFLACLVPLLVSIPVFIAELVCWRVEIAIKKYFHRILKSKCKFFWKYLRNLEIETCDKFDEVSSDQQNNVQNNFDDIDGIYSIGEYDEIDELVAKCDFRRHDLAQNRIWGTEKLFQNVGKHSLRVRTIKIV